MEYVKVAESEFLIIPSPGIIYDTKGRVCEMKIQQGEIEIRLESDEERQGAVYRTGEKLRFLGRVKILTSPEAFCYCLLFDPV